MGSTNEENGDVLSNGEVLSAMDEEEQLQDSLSRRGFFCEVCRSVPSLIHSRTTREQSKTEQKVARIFNDFMSSSALKTLNSPSIFSAECTIDFLKKGLFRSLSSSYCSLDASRPWICYWSLHCLSMLGYQCSEEEASKVVHFLNKCKDSKRGGYGGGPCQVAHAAPTYAAVNALCILGTEEALLSIDRQQLANFFLSLHQPDGSYVMHEDGEVDVRGVYCCASVATLLNLMHTPSSSPLFANSASWVSSCQTYEGGFSAVPFSEAHGGYTFCGWASLNLLDRVYLCEMESLVKWLSSRQMAFEGGFSGRPNKLVDSCYSFWQLAPLYIAQCILQTSPKEGAKGEGGGEWDRQASATRESLEELGAPLFNAEALTEYVLLCCQNYNGGFRDKPGANRDFYHTCYALSGLSLAHNYPSPSELHRDMGPLQLEPINPLFNVTHSSADRCRRFFANMPTVSVSSE